MGRYLVGSSVRLYPNILVPQSGGPARIQAREELYMQNVSESCPFRACMSFVVGGAFGAFIGLFSSSVAPQNTDKIMTTRETLIDRVWGSDYVGDTKTLDVHVKRLRSKLEADPANPTRITTIRGLGYKFERA